MVQQSPSPTAPLLASSGQWDALQDQLQRVKLKILTEIQHYPTPIPHCDQQFNWLLDQRNEVSEELQRLEDLRERERAALAAFVQGSRFLGSDA